jgi:hypothetical protein
MESQQQMLTIDNTRISPILAEHIATNGINSILIDSIIANYVINGGPRHGASCVAYPVVDMNDGISYVIKFGKQCNIPRGIAKEYAILQQFDH